MRCFAGGGGGADTPPGGHRFLVNMYAGISPAFFTWVAGVFCPTLPSRRGTVDDAFALSTAEFVDVAHAPGLAGNTRGDDALLIGEPPPADRAVLRWTAPQLTAAAVVGLRGGLSCRLSRTDGRAALLMLLSGDSRAWAVVKACREVTASPAAAVVVWRDEGTDSSGGGIDR